VISFNNNKVFGGWNSVSYTLCTGVGFGILAYINIFSKRTIRKI